MEEKCLLEEGVDFPAQKISAEESCDDPVLVAARKAFGITYFFPWQRIVIANILDSEFFGDDEPDECSVDSDVFYRGRQIVLLPTGAGKSLCFLAPSLLLSGPTLILYPLLALMSDQKRRMDAAGIESVVFRGGQSQEEREENFRRIHSGARVILANPEVLQSESLVSRLKDCGIRHIAIDEAHCVSEWGDTFRPAYLTLGKIIVELGVRTATAFTATASPEVLSRISEVLFGGNVHVVRGETDRPNISYSVVNTYAKKRTAFMLALREQKPLLVFCGTRAKAEDMARELSAYLGEGKAKFYHAGLAREEKAAVEKWFYPKKDGILCCTCAFGMGVDKPDVRTVIHLEAPKTAEAYIQEAGRAGRDGGDSKAILLWSWNDSVAARKIPDDSRASVMRKFAEAKTCRRQILLDALGGEQAACSGCDVCRTGRPAPHADDAAFMMELVAKNENCMTVDELNALAIRSLNKNRASDFEVNIYEHTDTQEIFSQLASQKLLRVRGLLWGRTVALTRPRRPVPRACRRKQLAPVASPFDELRERLL